MIGDNLTGEALYAYTAGIIDGEGHIGIFKVTSPKDKPRYGMRVIVAITHPWLPYFLKSKFGGSICLRKGRKPQHSDAWVWTIAAKKAKPFLTHVLPYLCLKNQQAELALNFQSRRKKRGKYLTSEEKILDVADKILMNSYNKKGQVKEEAMQ